MLRIMKDACVVSGVAAATAAAVFAVARPRAVVAEGEAKAAPVERPALKVDGVVLTLELDKRKYEAGEKPKLTLVAVNTRDNEVSLHAVLTMMTAPPSSPMMRMIPRPKESWSHKCALRLAPAETKTVELTADKALAAGESATFNIAVGKNTVTAAWVAVQGPDGAAGPIFFAPAKPEDVGKLISAAKEVEAQAKDARSAAKTETETK